MEVGKDLSVLEDLVQRDRSIAYMTGSSQRGGECHSHRSGLDFILRRGEEWRAR